MFLIIWIFMCIVDVRVKRKMLLCPKRAKEELINRYHTIETYLQESFASSINEEWNLQEELICFPLGKPLSSLAARNLFQQSWPLIFISWVASSARNLYVSEKFIKRVSTEADQLP